MIPKERVRPSRFYNIIGKSKPLLTVLDLVKKAAPSSATVLISGESGVGKELVARAIHELSPRSSRPFVAVNCAALTETLLESELFGHEKGAFTGAVSMKKGRFELADGGTLFFDEIGELPLNGQVKLLRAIEQREFERTGGIETIKVNLRIIAATNKDLEQGSQQGWFREDLFYRLNVIAMEIPALRERQDDLSLLIDRFMAEFARENAKNIPKIACDAFEVLVNYPYPGNVRELKNIIEHAIVLSDNGNITLEDLPKKLLKAKISGGKPISNFGVRETELINALTSIKLNNNGREPKMWHKSLRSVTIETIRNFFLKTTDRPFSRKEFANFLRNHSKSDTDKYKTAGDYLRILKENNVCIHNGKKANKSGYRLAERFVANAQSFSQEPVGHSFGGFCDILHQNG
jgi:transcriptional regulator with GAF, ATPase, and Fis domain